MFTRKILHFLIAIGLSLVSPVAAENAELDQASGRYSISPANSQIHFTVGNIGGGAIRGGFSRFDGLIDIDTRNVGRSAVTFTIFPDSVDGGESRITAFLKSDAIFDVAEFPQITFRSTRVVQTSDQTATIAGVITARGKSKPVTFLASLESYSGSTARFRVTGRVPRAPFGMDAGTPIYSNMVDFDISVTAKRH